MDKKVFEIDLIVSEFFEILSGRKAQSSLRACEISGNFVRWKERRRSHSEAPTVVLLLLMASPIYASWMGLGQEYNQCESKDH